MAGAALYNYPATGAACSFPGGNFADSNPICDWTYRYPVTIDHTKVAADLTNYLLYIDLSDLPSAFFTNVKVDGSDIRVTKSDGSTELAHYVGSIDDVTETGTLWVRYDGTLSSTVDTVIYIYFGNASASAYAVTATYGRNNTFQDYEAFWDFEQDPSGAAPQLVDLTGNGNNGTSAGSMTSGDLVTGKVGDAWDFDGSDDHANIGDVNIVDAATKLTVSTWVNLDTLVDNAQIISKWGTGTTKQSFLLGLSSTTRQGNNDITFAVRAAVGAMILDSNTNAITTGNYIKITGTWNGGLNGYIYVNGIVQTTSNQNSGIPLAIQNATEPLAIGARQDGLPAIFLIDGKISLGSIKTTYESAHYIATEYANQNTPSTFYTIGTLETS